MCHWKANAGFCIVGLPWSMLKLMTVFGLQARNGADGAILDTGTAMQAVLGLYAI